MWKCLKELMPGTSKHKAKHLLIDGNIMINHWFLIHTLPPLARTWQAG